SGIIRHNDDREVDDVWSRPRPGLLRCACGAGDHARCGTERLSFFGSRSRYRREHTVSNEENPMIVTKMALSRRTFLRGAGVTLALPLLDSMLPAFTASAAVPAARRLGYVYIPMGMNRAAWIPGDEGRLVDFSPSLASLKPHADQVTVITNTD